MDEVKLSVGYKGITLIESGLGGEGKERLLDMIKRSVDEKKRTYLIVPEQQTVMAEAEMSELLSPESNLNFEACNFTRFANTVFRSLGGVSGEYCDGSKKQLLMWRALTELSDVLYMTRGKREVSSGLVERTMAAVNEMQSLSITPDMLEDAADLEEVREDARLHTKIKDLSVVLTRYKQLVSEKYADTADDVFLATKKLEDNPEFFCDAHIYVEGFTSFTEPQYKLIELLSKRCGITVLLYIQRSRADCFEYTELKSTRNRILRIADLNGIKKRAFKYDEGYTAQSSVIREITRSLWSTSYEIDNDCLQNAQNIRIFKAHTPYEEFDFLADDIRRRVTLGDRYSDFAVVARDAKAYDGVIDSALKKAGIPAFTSYKRDISAFEAIKLIYTAYACIRSGFAREDVILYSKCGLCGIDADERDEFELYCERWQITGKRFTDGIEWNMNPSGYSITRAKNADAQLVRINSVRRRLIEPLLTFKQSVSGIRTVSEHATALFVFLLDVGLEKELEAASERLLTIGEKEAALENEKLWKIICDALDVVVEVLGEYSTDAEGFLNQFKTVVSNADVGRIPAQIDGVTVGSADMLRLTGKKHIYLVGVNAGEFPGAVSDNSYFSDKDRSVLCACGLSIEPDLEIKSARELFCFSRALSYAKETVTLLFTEKTMAYKSLQPSDAIERITALTRGKVKPVAISSLGIKDRTYSPKIALESLGDMSSEEYESLKLALDAVGMKESILVAEKDITNTSLYLGEEYSSTAKGRPLALTQTRIDTFVSCPLSYYCKYLLKLSEQKKAEFDAANIGSFVHSILENVFKEIREEKKSISELSDMEKYALTEKAAKKYLLELGESEVGSARFRITVERLCRAAIPVVDGLCDEFSKCSFTPTFFELKIGDKSAESPEATVFKTKDGSDVFVYGTIDRVDTLEKNGDVYVRVIDYKTGTKDFSPEDIKEGKNLQMFLYLKSITDTDNESFKEAIGVGDNGRILPAGVIYVKTSVKDEKIRHSSDEDAIAAAKHAQEREGMLLDDLEIIEAMNTDYIPVKFKDGVIDEKSKRYLYSSERWKNMMNELEEVVTGVADRIKSGEIRAITATSKKGDGCSYCEFKPICRIKEL